MATGPTGPINPGVHAPFSTEWLKAKKKELKRAGLADATEQASDVYTPSQHAQKMALGKDEKMLSAMRKHLAELDPNSESFLEEATEKLIDSVIDQEYGDEFKKKPGYPLLQDKITTMVLENPASRDALTDFFELLLLLDRNEEPEELREEPSEEEAEGEAESYEDEDVEEDEETV